jgi:hypothetical protein
MLISVILEHALLVICWFPPGGRLTFQATGGVRPPHGLLKIEQPGWAADERAHSHR